MGNAPPNISLYIQSDCCNAKDEGESDEKDMVQPKRPNWFRRSIKSFKVGKTIQKANKELVKQSAVIQFAQTDEEAIPNTEISS